MGGAGGRTGAPLGLPGPQKPVVRTKHPPGMRNSACRAAAGPRGRDAMAVLSEVAPDARKRARQQRPWSPRASPWPPVQSLRAQPVPQASTLKARRRARATGPRGDAKDAQHRCELQELLQEP